MGRRRADRRADHELHAPHHPGAAEATAWLAAGPHVCHTHGGLDIRTPPPERRKVGHLPPDYWDGNRFTKPYEVVVDSERDWLNRELDSTPLEPTSG
jgi:hypothetical protein